MASTEERQCHHCGTFHLRDISFFAYWTRCRECGTFLCPRCSGYNNSRITQFTFLAYMLISYIFYFGIFLIIAPIHDPGINIFSPYILSAILLFIPFLALLLIIRSAIRRMVQQNKNIIEHCPQCNSSMKVVYHDIYLYFWLFFIHILYLSTILNETGIFFFNEVSSYSLSLWFVVLLTGVFIVIIWVFKQIGNRFLPTYKTNTRVWLGEIFAIFLYVAINVVFLLFISTDDFLFSFNLFYYFASVTFWYFPAFLIGSLIYKLAQSYLLNVNKSRLIQILIAVLFITGSFYIWGFIGLYLGGLYTALFIEIIPIFLLSFLLGLSVTTIFRNFFSKSSNSKLKIYHKIPVFLGVSLLLGSIVIENLYYVINGTFLFDIFDVTIVPSILAIVMVGILSLLFYEILINWASPQKRWGKTIEKHLGSLLYPILIGFIIAALALTPSIIISMFSSTLSLSLHAITTNIFTLKLVFTISLTMGLLIGLKK